MEKSSPGMVGSSWRKSARRSCWVESAPVLPERGLQAQVSFPKGRQPPQAHLHPHGSIGSAYRIQTWDLQVAGSNPVYQLESYSRTFRPLIPILSVAF